MKYKLLLLTTSCALPLCAQDDIKDQFNPVMTAVVSQSIAGDARAASMGDLGAATDPDVNSQAWNPAKYPFTISRSGLAINYTPWLRQLTNDIALLNAVGYYRIGDYQAVSGSLRYFSLGEVITESGDMTIKPYEMAVDIAYSRMLSETFSAGVALRYIYSDLSGHYDDNVKPGSAFAADISAYNQSYVIIGQRECQLGLGLNISNIGSKISYGDDYSYFIPTNLRLGASLLVPIDEYNRISFSADINKLLVPSMPLKLEGEEEAGLCSGTENCWAVNKKASEEDIKATLDFLKWVVTSESGTKMMAEQFGPIPFKAAKESENVFFTAANKYIADGKYVVTWAFNYTPNVETWRAGVVSAMLQYSANGGSWDDVETAFVDGWATQYEAQK